MIGEGLRVRAGNSRRKISGATVAERGYIRDRSLLGSEEDGGLILFVVVLVSPTDLV